MTTARGRPGRPPLTEERRAAVRLEIAHAAVELFVAQGVTATTGEQIGRAAGVSARTVWRYFPTKESCVRPLFSAGIDMVAAALRRWQPGRSLEQAFDDLWTVDSRLPGLDIGALLRLTRTEPGLRAVWLQTHDEAEPAFARALAERAGLPPDDARPAIGAAMLNAALRAAVEHHAYRTTDPGSDREEALADLIGNLRTAVAMTSAGLL
ncbi:hypothetical protein SUDANB58_05698 [Streptomyces sp. enrichment culture]|uniref:TetR/AcrR family transcriptional regulator n=1 Tax=Streptomyces sp. enrichment culture TaxID=1795815 RepID=UPI003F577F47